MFAYPKYDLWYSKVSFQIQITVALINGASWSSAEEAEED